MKKIHISKRANDFLINLPAKQSKQNFVAILRLAKNPQPHNAEKLKGCDNLYRIDVGEYRIVYYFDTEVVYIVLVGKRNDGEIYAQLKQML